MARYLRTTSWQTSYHSRLSFAGIFVAIKRYYFFSKRNFNHRKSSCKTFSFPFQGSSTPNFASSLLKTPSLTGQFSLHYWNMCLLPQSRISRHTSTPVCALCQHSANETSQSGHFWTVPHWLSEFSTVFQELQIILPIVPTLPNSQWHSWRGQ